MKLVSINTGKIQTQPWREGTKSALYKQPVLGAIALGVMGLEGDEQADLKNHGGEDKAVLVLPEASYDYFKIAQPFGFLGDNLIFSGLDETEVCLGDRFQIGSVLLEVTQPRSPCWKLGEQASNQAEWSSIAFLKAYSESGRVGFYCRVLATGQMHAGQSVTWLTRESETEAKKTPIRITIQQLFLAKHHHKTEQDWDFLQAALKHPALSKAWHKSITHLINTRQA